MLIPLWSSLGEDWRVVFPPPASHLNFVCHPDSGSDCWVLKGDYSLVWVWNTLSNYVLSPQIPSMSYFFILYLSLECSGWVLTISIGITPHAFPIFIHAWIVLVGNSRHQISYLLCDHLIQWFTTSPFYLWISICPHYSGFSPHFRHTTSKCLCFSFPQSHYQLTILGIWLVVQISEGISKVGLEPMKQAIFQMPVTIFLSHGIRMLLCYYLKSPF